MMKKIILVVFSFAFFLSGCGTQNYLAPSLSKIDSMQIILNDFVYYLKKVYVPGNTSFSINESTSSMYTTKLTHTLRRKGYGVCNKTTEESCSNALEITSVIDLIEKSYIRSSFYVDGKVISRLYRLTSDKRIERYGAITVYKQGS